MTKRFLPVLILFFIFLVSTPWMYAQTSIPPSPREALIQAIEERAQRDAELGKAQEGITELNVLFGDEAKAVGLPMRDALLIYEEAYAAALPVEPWWTSLRPTTGWIVIGILFLLAIFQNIIKDYLTRFFRWLTERLYNRVAGYKPFWWIALRRYRRELVEKYKEIKIPFRLDRPLKMEEVYVPLKVSGSGNLDLIDAYQAVARYQRLMIVGAPGAGKSMLLKNIALTYAQSELIHFPTQPIPILLELHRLNDPQLSLRDQLTQVLERSDFPNAGNFIRTGLEHGLLLLLFDGLDEVNSQMRRSVVGKIKALLEQHHDCRALVSCRTMVYKGEFDEWVEQKLEIVEFNDQQIQRFLNSWQTELPADKSIAHLLRNLRERPRIMALARNPLLLTIIAYLYADTAFVLPHSRAEFYDKAIDVLLDQWKGERNQYKAAHKQLVLQHLALFNQDSAAQRDQDRRSIDLPVILTEIKQVLPKLNLPGEVAQPILDEIVERSGLLLSIDGGLKYQFTHLTLQEFFAAQALEGQINDLFARFAADPNVWRETVKLWCGLPQNSSPLIRKIYAYDPITAFEALGDALQVDDDLANEITTAFKLRLGEDDDAGEGVARALAAVAVDPGIRGWQMFDFLAEIVTRDDPKRRLAAANALALTNLPRAADTLAECAPNRPDLRRPLAQMGNLAVPALAKWAADGQTWALDDLQLIGTSLAAQALAGLLWNGGGVTPHLAAWYLATLLHKPGVETALREFPLSSEQRRAESLDWVWEPFEADSNSPVRVITGRMAYLLNTTPTATVSPNPPSNLDPRMVIPLYAITIQQTKDKLNKQIQEYLFRSLTSSLQSDLSRRLQEATPTIDDWRNIFRPVKYEFKGSWQARGIKLALVILIFLGLWGVGSVIWRAPQFLSWKNGLSIVMMLVLIAMLEWTRRGQLDLDGMAVIAALGLLSVGPLAGYIMAIVTGNWIYGALVGASVGALVGASVGALVGTLNGALVGALVSASGSALAGAIGSVNGGAFVGAIGVLIVSALVGTIGGAIVGASGGASGVEIGGILGASSVEIVNASVGARIGAIGGAIGGALISVLGGAIFGALVGILIDYQLIYLPTMLLFNWLGWIGAAVLWLVWLDWVALLWHSGVRRQREAQNPLQGLLELESGVAAGARRRRVGLFP